MEQEKKKLNVKIIIPVIVAIVVISIVGIISSGKNEISTTDTENTSETKELHIGDTYISEDGMWKVTLKNMQYVEMNSGKALCGSIDKYEEFLTVGDYADDTLSRIPRYGSIVPVSFFYDIEYLGKNKCYYTHSQIILDYNDGYIVDSDVEDDSFGLEKSRTFFQSLYWKRLGEYKITLDPLKSDVCDIEFRQYVYVPKEIMENTNKPLKVTIKGTTEDYQTVSAEFRIR